MAAFKIILTGHVQGVFLRAGAVKKAHELNVRGWVRNMEDGSVNIFAEGEELALLEFEEWCHHGPPAAKVERVRREETEEEGYKNFEIRY